VGSGLSIGVQSAVATHVRVLYSFGLLQREQRIVSLVSDLSKCITHSHTCVLAGIAVHCCHSLGIELSWHV
jgi:hypothetical protein